MTKVTTVGIDLAKSVFQVHGGEARAVAGAERSRNPLRPRRVVGRRTSSMPTPTGR